MGDLTITTTLEPFGPATAIILTDDQGWGDAHFAGHPYVKTPNIDRLAKEGTDFTRFTVEVRVGALRDFEGARRIAQNLYREIRDAHAWGAAFPEVLDDAVVDRLATVAPREMRRTLIGAFGNAKLARRHEVQTADLPTDRSMRRQRIGF